MTIIIDSITTAHLPQLHALILKEDHAALIRTLGFLPTVDDLKRQTVADPDYDPALVIGAFMGDKLIGAIAGITRTWKQEHDATGFVKCIVIHKKYRRQGVG